MFNCRLLQIIGGALWVKLDFCLTLASHHSQLKGYFLQKLSKANKRNEPQNVISNNVAF